MATVPSEPVTCIGLPDPIHIHSADEQAECQQCHRAVWLTVSVVKREQRQVRCPACGGKEIEDVLPRILFAQCCRILHRVASQRAVSSWDAILARSDMQSQPYGTHLGMRNVLLAHACAYAVEPDLLSHVLRRWPQSVNAITEVGEQLCVCFDMTNLCSPKVSRVSPRPSVPHPCCVPWCQTLPPGNPSPPCSACACCCEQKQTSTCRQRVCH